MTVLSLISSQSGQQATPGVQLIQTQRKTMKQVILMGSLLLAVVSFNAQAQSSSTGSGTGNGTNGSSAQNGSSDPTSKSGQYQDRKMNRQSGKADKNSTTYDTRSNSGSTQTGTMDQGGTQGKNRTNRKMKQGTRKMSADSSSNQ